MNKDSGTRNPKITLYKKKIIPRWGFEFTKILMNSKPKIFFIECNSTEYDYYQFKGLLKDDSFLRNYGHKIYTKLSIETKLSEELLEANNSLVRKYEIVKFINGKSLFKNTDNYYVRNYLMLVDKNDKSLSVFSSEQFYSSSGNSFSENEYEHLQSKLNEIYFEGDITIELIRNIIR